MVFEDSASCRAGRNFGRRLLVTGSAPTLRPRDASATRPRFEKSDRGIEPGLSRSSSSGIPTAETSSGSVPLVHTNVNQARPSTTGPSLGWYRSRRLRQQPQLPFAVGFHVRLKKSRRICRICVNLATGVSAGFQGRRRVENGRWSPSLGSPSATAALQCPPVRLDRRPADETPERQFADCFSCGPVRNATRSLPAARPHVHTKTFLPTSRRRWPIS